MSTFKVGDEVEWTSQAAGSTTTKRGIVVYTSAMAEQNSDTLEAWSRPRFVVRQIFPSHQIMFDGGRWHKSGVLVEVNDSKAGRAKPKLYMPFPSKLKKVEPS